jgi:hypothetical protein
MGGFDTLPFFWGAIHAMLRFLRNTLCKGATRRNIFLATLYLFLDNPAPLF